MVDSERETQSCMRLCVASLILGLSFQCVCKREHSMILKFGAKCTLPEPLCNFGLGILGGTGLLLAKVLPV